LLRYECLLLAYVKNSDVHVKQHTKKCRGRECMEPYPPLFLRNDGEVLNYTECEDNFLFVLWKYHPQNRT